MAGYFEVDSVRVSPNHNYLAYILDTTGVERLILQVKNLSTGILENLRVDEVADLVWAQDGCTLFYTISDENKRPYRQFFNLYIESFVLVFS